MMRNSSVCAPILGGLLWALSPSAAAQDTAGQAGEPSPTGPVVVVELFTSQACNRCPAANALMGELIGHDGVLGLSFSVDYWTAMGWEDTLAQPAFTQRQRDYVAHLSNRRVYTPQFVFNGAQNVRGAAHNHDTVRTLLEDALSAPTPLTPPMDLQVAWRGQTLEITNLAANEEHAIWVAGYTPGLTTVEVTRGANANKTIGVHNAVTDLVRVDTGVTSMLPTNGEQGDATPRSHNVTAPDAGAIAILVHDAVTQTIVAAHTLTRPDPDTAVTPSSDT